MKKICKAITSLALMLLFTAAFAATAFAESPAVTFKSISDGFDFKPGSEYTETDLFGNFKDVMPGDTVTETITYTNAAADCDFVKLYLRAEAHDEKNPLTETVAETENTASMAEFLSQLSMKVWNGTELIYEASPDELGGLKENRLLGTFRTGQSGTLTVELTVPAELDNKFANRTGEVDWVFHVDGYNDSPLPADKTAETPAATSKTSVRSLIQTGQLIWPIWVLGGAGLALILGGAIVMARKKREDD